MDEKLAEVFSFAQADLEANRNGNLTESQLQAFRQDTRQTLLVFQVVLFLLPIPIIINYLNFNVVLCGFVFALMEAAAILIYQNLRNRSRFTLKAGDLKVVEGVVRFRGRKRYIYVGDERFLVNKAQYYFLDERAFYRFYFTENRIWSCEKL